MEDVGIFHGNLVYFKAVWYILCPFGLFCGHLVHFSPFWYVENLATLEPNRDHKLFLVWSQICENISAEIYENLLWLNLSFLF
jgi:hypothetical protein